MIPTRNEAETLLAWASELNPGPWIEHSKTAAMTAEKIARECSMNGNQAYVLGLLHDIGRYEGRRDLHHMIAGYTLMSGKGYLECARICLTHSFPIQDIAAHCGKSDCTQDEITFMSDAIKSMEYNDYDRLIQLCDALSLPGRVTIVERRLIDVTLRYGFNALTIKKWESIFALKGYFDDMCGLNIYQLFQDALCADIFG